ncbi:HU family DNA-binding protein [Segatella copri]|jgi:putative DNA-binding protein|uniref:HU family DNA-binding protein n=1 Tax=Segatella copri TaxID=165179 RepID=UPI00294B8660|nr:DNA-binding protein [Segatella copri]
MGIKVKAIERNVAFEKGKQKWAYVMQADLYGQLTQSKVIEEAAVRSGLAKQVINAAWGAIGAVITAWATEGHSVAVPGLGSLRFGLNSTAVEDVNKVSSSLINRRYIIFVPNADIKEELAKTSVNITCYDRNGKIVKQVTSADKNDTGEGDNKDNTNQGGGTSQGGGTNQGGDSNQGGNPSQGGGSTDGEGNGDNVNF